MLPLEGIIVLDMSQFLAGPYVALKLADLGARVIKIERPETGDLCRYLYITDVRIDGDSTPFHTINRNKESFTANLKAPGDFEKVKALVRRADVLIENFRPGVMKRIGLDYEAARELNPRLIYGRITGYGDDGPWRDFPGQDLLAQSRSGLVWLSGSENDPPVPMGLAMGDMLAGAALTQAILACLVRRGLTGQGGLAETSLMEAMLDAQFEVLPTYLAGGCRPVKRSAHNGAHAFIAAPYGIYETTDGFIALAMCPIDTLGKLLKIPELTASGINDQAFTRRDEIKRAIAARLKTATTRHWLDVLQPADVWCSEVLTWEEMLKHEAFKTLDMLQTVTRTNGVSLQTLRAPFRIDGQILSNPRAAPKLGEHTAAIEEEFGLTD